MTMNTQFDASTSTDPDYVYRAGLRHAQQGRDTEALELFHRVLVLQSTHREAMYALVDIFRRQGRFVEMSRYFEIYVAINRLDLEARIDLADCYYMLAEASNKNTKEGKSLLSKAQACYLEVINTPLQRESVTTARANYRLSHLLGDLANYTEARIYANAAITMGWAYADPYRILGYAELGLGQFSQAKKALMMSFKKQSGPPRVIGNSRIPKQQST